MKFLKLKSIFFSLLAIAMVTVFLSSCEKDIIKDTSIEEVKSLTNINSLSTIKDEIEFNKPFKKVLLLGNNKTGKKADIQAAVRISSNSENILSNFSDGSIKIEHLNTLSEDNKSYKNIDYHNHNGNCEEHKDESIDIKTFDGVVNIEIIVPPNKDDESGFNIKFSNELVSKFEGKNIITQIKLLKAKPQQPLAKRNYNGGDYIDIGWYFGNEYDAMHVKSAVYRGGGKSTKVSTYHTHPNQYTSHLFSNKYFKYCHYTYDCRAGYYLDGALCVYGLVTDVDWYTHCNGRC